MLEFSDFELEIDRQKNMDWETLNNFLIINTVYEDDLEWEEEYVQADLIICDNVDEFNLAKLEYSNMNKIVDQNFPLRETNRLGLTEDFDILVTEYGNDFIEFDNNIYSSILFNVFINYDKTKVVFLGLLLE